MPIRSLLLQALILSYSLAAGAFYSNPPSIANEPEGLARLGIAVAAGLLGVIFRRRRDAHQDEWSGNSLAVDLLVIYGLVVFSQIMLNFLRPAIALPRWAPTQGGFVGFMLLAATRALFADPAAVDVSSQWDDGRLKELIIERNRYRTVYGSAASLAVGIGLLGLFMGTLRVQFASALIVMGSAYLLQRTFFSLAMTTAMSTEQQLLACIAILRGASAWYYLALLPASIVALYGSKMYLYWIPLVVLVFAEANQRATALLNSNIGAERPRP